MKGVCVKERDRVRDRHFWLNKAKEKTLWGMKGLCLTK